MLKNNSFSYVDLCKSDDSIIRIHFDSDYLAIWSDTKYGNYVAIEPWNGYPDEINPKLEFIEKAAMKILEPNQAFSLIYKIEIIKS